MRAPLSWRVYSQICRRSPDPAWGMFPRPPVSPVAKALGVSRATVWRLVAAMQRSGFLAEYEIVPNPRLLGVGLRSFNVTVPDPSARARVLDNLERVEGTFVVLQSLEVPVRVNLFVLASATGSKSRAEEEIVEMEDVGEVTRAGPVWLPECPSRISLEGWEFVSLIRQHPSWSLEQIARVLGISAKTASKRYRALRESRALLGFSLEDFTKFPGIVLGVLLAVEPGANPALVARAVQREFPELVPGASATHPSGVISAPIVFLANARNAWEIEGMESSMAAVPGVARVDTFFPGAARSYPRWFDARIAEQLARERRAVRRSDKPHASS